MSFAPFINIQPEIKDALREGKPVVALESTIIAHGMPYPENIKTALEVEEIVRKFGAIPATIAILGGKLCIGLDQNQLERIGNSENVWKVSTRDIPFVLSQKLSGATTVAATMRIASMVGVKIFVTGGIGGVHREAPANMDISADLTEMSETSVAVVSAGVKSILDIGLTLEYLETKGIPVITFGQDEFPSFYSRQSGFTSPIRMNDADAIAHLLRIKWELELKGSALITLPVPEHLEIPFEKMELVIREALSEANRQKISGKLITPFLLKYISRETGGESLKTNIALIKNNAELGAKISVALQKH